MSYSVSVRDLNELTRDSESGLQKLQELGGVAGICRRLQVEVDQGISASSAADRRRVFGENRVPERPPKSYLAYLWDAFEDFTIRLLCACAFISITIAVIFQREEELSWLEGVAILATVLAVCNIQAAQDYAKERSFRALNAVVQTVNVPVVRDGKDAEVVVFDIVVGDVVKIGVGDIIEADGVLIKGEDVECDESALTGEPEDIKKDSENAPFVFSGTAVKNGTGMYLATAVGINSMSGKITALIRGQKLDAGNDEKNAVVEDAFGPAKSADSGAVMNNIVRTLSKPEQDATFKPKGSKDSKDKKNDPAKALAQDMADKGGPEAVEPEAKQAKQDKEEADEGEETSVLKAKLELMVVRISYLAFGSAGIASLVMLVRFCIENYVTLEKSFSMEDDPVNFLEAVVTGIAIVVVAVPEGLPLAVTLALSLSMRKMQADQNLVKHLDATETMGSATTICSDKTGTLTQNRMTVVRAFAGGREFIGEHSNDRTCGKLLDADRAVSKELKEKLSEAVCINKADGTEIEWDKAADRWEQRGNKTDCALLAFSDDMNFKYKEIRDRPLYKTIDKHGNPQFGIKMYPFSSARKRSGQAVSCQPGSPNGRCRLYVKGASEMILKLCSYQARLDGSVGPLTDATRQSIFKDVVDKFASGAMRTIAIAYREFSSPPDWDEELDADESYRLTGQTAKTYKAETGLTLLAVCGIHDPIRDGVPLAITQCNNAGIDVRMVTGDHKATAIAIAKDCGILRRGIDYKDAPGQPLAHRYTAMTGDEFRGKVTDDGSTVKQEAFDEVWPYLRVLARSSPEDKHTLVSGLCESDLYLSDRAKELCIYPDRQVVAVTGDGTNDAPALRRAHVGFAMNITGTRVAQDAADILLLDDRFESVVKACLWGRNVYDSIAKFLQFQLTVNISAVTIAVLGAVIVKGNPLTVVQMLWVNLIMDSLGALALANEPPTPDLLDRAPYGRTKSLLSYEMWFNLLGQSAYQLAVLILLFFFGAGEACPLRIEPEDWPFPEGGFLNMPTGIGRGHHADPTEHYTLVFNCFVFMQLANWINCRKLYHEYNVFRGIQNNPMFVVIWTICATVQVLLVQGAGFGRGSGVNPLFKTRKLDGTQWLVCIGFGAFSFVWQLVIVTAGRAMKPILVRDTEWKPLRADDVPATSFGAPQSSAAPEEVAVCIPVDDAASPEEATQNGVQESDASTSANKRSNRTIEDERVMREFTHQSSRVMEKNKALASPQVLMSSRPSSTRTS